MVSRDQIERNRVQQAELYGEPLGDLVRRTAAVLHLTQARVAEIVGISAPMLSQLMSGQRVKIGNPAVVQRLQALRGVALEADGLPADEVARRVAAVQGASGQMLALSASAAAIPVTDRRAVVRALQEVLREAGSAQEISDAAELLQRSHPRLAAVLRVYGTGRTDDALAHYASTVGTG